MTRSRGFLLNMLGKEASPTPFVVACTMLDLLVPRLVNDDSPYLDPQLPELKGEPSARDGTKRTIQIRVRSEFGQNQGDFARMYPNFRNFLEYSA